MDQKAALAALAALAQETRLELFRLLVMTGPEGLPAGIIAERLGVLPSSLTFHLNLLHRAGLISQRRRSRQLIYAAEYATMNALLAYLTENCCAGRVRSAIPVKSVRATRGRKLPAKRPAESGNVIKGEGIWNRPTSRKWCARAMAASPRRPARELLRAGTHPAAARPADPDSQIARDGLFGCGARGRAGRRQSRPWLRQSAGDCRI